MEKFGGVSDYMTLLNKINMYKLLMCIDDTQRAEICMSQAKYIVEKYGLKYDLDIDIDKFKSENQAVEDTAKNTEKASES
jgi:UDP-N-acetylmuramate-alanine ligase